MSAVLVPGDTKADIQGRGTGEINGRSVATQLCDDKKVLVRYSPYSPLNADLAPSLALRKPPVGSRLQRLQAPVEWTRIDEVNRRIQLPQGFGQLVRLLDAMRRQWRVRRDSCG